MPEVLMAKRPSSVDGIVAMSLQKALAVTFVACLLASCATIGAIEVSGDPAALPLFRTFRVLEVQFAFATDINSEQVAKISSELRAAAVSALEERGYEQAADADMLIALAALSRPTLPAQDQSTGGSTLHHVDTSVLDSGQPSTPPQSEIPSAHAGREGDLMLSLLDPRTQRAVWLASSNGAATTPAEALRKARATYAAMVARLPKAPPRAGGGPP
jgi:hypothetical protein